MVLAATGPAHPVIFVDVIVKSLKPVYTALSEAAAKDRFEEFAAEWGQRYPAIVRLWKPSWAQCRAVPRIRRRDPACDLHDQRNRVNQRPLRGAVQTRATSPTSKPR